jgi:hypothetical protein
MPSNGIAKRQDISAFQQLAFFCCNLLSNFSPTLAHLLLVTEAMSPLVTPPPLTIWEQQLAGIVPLSALVEFIDVATKLHIFELTGTVPIWNWPVTPTGARLLLSDEDTTDACCLDRVAHSVTLHCIDGRFGDLYPSSTPTTTRLSVSTKPVGNLVPNDAKTMMDVRGRKQTMEVVHITSLAADRDDKGLHQRLRSSRIYRAITSILGEYSTQYILVNAGGWLCWASLVVFTLLSHLYVAAAYLLLMPPTGLLVRLTHGGKPRRLLDERISPFTRLVVAADSVNGSEWKAFYGGSYALNSLLNKPLYRTGSVATTPLTRCLLRLLLRLAIAGQWVLAVGSCALQDWNAFVVTFWIIFCAVISLYVYPPSSSVRDWLRYTCRLAIERIRADFSSRRAMLSAMVYLNPDSREGRTEWINPILAPSEDRREWQTALLEFMDTGVFISLSLSLSLFFCFPLPQFDFPWIL